MPQLRRMSPSGGVAVVDFKDDIRRAAARSRQERINKGAVIGAAVAPDIKERAVLRTVAAAEIRHVHRRKRRSGRLRLGEWSGLRDIQAVIVHLDEIGVTRACKLCLLLCGFQFAQVIVHYRKGP